MMNEVKFEDFLMFTESKNKNIARSILDKPEDPGKSMSDDLGFMRDREIEALSDNRVFLEFTDTQRKCIIDRIQEIYNNPEIILNMEVERNPKVEEFEKITKEMVDTYSRKNHDYGDSFGESIKKYGPIAGLVRLSDKWNRLNSLILGGDVKVKDESITDTLTDLACYAIMLRMEMTRE